MIRYESQKRKSLNRYKKTSEKFIDAMKDPFYSFNHYISLLKVCTKIVYSLLLSPGQGKFHTPHLTLKYNDTSQVFIFIEVQLFIEKKLRGGDVIIIF